MPVRKPKVTKTLVSKKIIKKVSSPKVGIKTKAPEHIDETEFNLVVYIQENGCFNSKLLSLNVAPFDVFSPEEVLKINKIQIHKQIPKASGRYKSIPCKDENGLLFDSMLELIVYKEIEVYKELGYIDNLDRQITYPFEKFVTYTPDILFRCIKPFCMALHRKAKANFEPNVYYVTDVKSPLTKNDASFKWKKFAMKKFHDIDVVILLRSYGEPKKTNRKIKRK